MQPATLSILGVGLLGGSIGLALRSVSSSCKIKGYGHRAATLDHAVKIGAIDKGYDDLADSVRDSELVILCTPVGLFREILSKIAGELRPGAIVTDVGSTKRSVVRQAEAVLPRSVHFVGSHPMAGSEKRGIEFARADLFRNALCITTPTPATDSGALEKIESFWQQLGMRIQRLSPGDHDSWISDVAHLPHAVAAALVEMQDDAALSLAGKGFLDTTRIAGGDGGLWRDIFLDNRDNLLSGIRRLRNSLEHLAKLLDDGKSEEVRAWLTAAAERRQRLLQQKLREMSPD